MRRQITFVVPRKPVAKGRPRFARLPTGFIRTYTPKATSDFENSVRAIAGRAMDGKTLLDGPVSVRIQFNMQIPKWWPKKKRQAASIFAILPTTKPDLDNLAKSVLDAINGIVFADDSQITDLIITKRYGPPSVKVAASEIAAGGDGESD